MDSTTSESVAWRAYARSLAVHGYGYPLWDANPTEDYGEIFVGDVGYIRGGVFKHLFHTVQESYPQPLNNRCPEGFEKLSPPNLLVTKPYRKIDQPHVLSRSIKGARVEGGASILLPGQPVSASANIKFSCQEDSGALLLLEPPAMSVDIENHRMVKSYMKQQFKRWYDFANREYGIGLADDEILFVTGTTKTTAWIATTFHGHDKTEEATFSCDIQKLADFKCSVTISRSEKLFPNPDYKWGPSAAAARDLQDGRGAARRPDSAKIDNILYGSHPPTIPNAVQGDADEELHAPVGAAAESDSQVPTVSSTDPNPGSVLSSTQAPAPSAPVPRAPTRATSPTGPSKHKQSAVAPLAISQSYSASSTLMAHPRDVDEQLPVDQCIFVQYCKLKRRSRCGIFPPKFKMSAAAGPHGPSRGRRSDGPPDADSAPGVLAADADDDSGYSWDDSTEFSGTAEEREREVEDPVVAILNYVLESSEASVAMASTMDVFELFKGETRVPDDVGRVLRRRRPAVEVDESGVGTLALRHWRTDMSARTVQARAPVRTSTATVDNARTLTCGRERAWAFVPGDLEARFLLILPACQCA